MVRVVLVSVVTNWVAAATSAGSVAPKEGLGMLQAFVKKGSATIGAIHDTNLGSATIGHTTKLEAALEASLIEVVRGEASVATLPTANVLDGITLDMTSIQEEVDCCGPEPSTGCTSTVPGCTTKGLAVAALDSIKSAEQAVKDALVVDFADCCTPSETMLVEAQTAHSTCRGEQKTTQTAVVTHCGSSSDLETTGKTVHTKVELAGNCGDTSNAGGTVMMDKLVSFKALYDDYYEQLYTAKEACSKATADHGTADPPVGKVAECNGKQRSFEMISCERQTALDQYCTDRLNNYNTVKQTADTKRKPEEDHLQGLWGSAYRVKCFIDLVKAVGPDGSAENSTNNITETKVTRCATETIPFPAQLTFVYTDTSTFGIFACAGTDTHISPDESGFEEHYYNVLDGTKTPQSCDLIIEPTPPPPTAAPTTTCSAVDPSTFSYKGVVGFQNQPALTPGNTLYHIGEMAPVGNTFGALSSPAGRDLFDGVEGIWGTPGSTYSAENGKAGGMELHFAAPVAVQTFTVHCVHQNQDEVDHDGCYGGHKDFVNFNVQYWDGTEWRSAYSFSDNGSGSAYGTDTWHPESGRRSNGSLQGTIAGAHRASSWRFYTPPNVISHPTAIRLYVSEIEITACT